MNKKIIDQDSLATAAGLQALANAIRLGKCKLAQPLTVRAVIATSSDRDLKRLVGEVAIPAIGDQSFFPVLTNGKKHLISKITSSKLNALFESAAE
ncbi:MAG: hypothetical protein PUA61_01800 [Succinatimonas hippei]|nr:hypothetical protein [Succinatimonas hippei]